MNREPDITCFTGSESLHLEDQVRRQRITDRAEAQEEYFSRQGFQIERTQTEIPRTIMHALSQFNPAPDSLLGYWQGFSYQAPDKRKGGLTP